MDMYINEVNEKLLQRYGKERIDFILNKNISYLTHHIKKICQFVYDEGADIDTVQKAFRQYEQLKNQGEGFDYRNLNFIEFMSVLNNSEIKDIALPNVIYTSQDKMIQIGKFNTFEEAKEFGNNTNITCCFCNNEEAWIMYNNNFKLYVIRNLYQSLKSRLRYVIVTVKDNVPYYFDMDDKSLKKERGEQVFQQYIQSLNGAESTLLENKNIYNSIIIENKQYNKNRKMKRTIRLNEADLHRIVKESVNKILREMDDEFADDEQRQQETKLKDQQARSEGKEPYYFISDTYQLDGSFIKVWLKPEQLVNGKFNGKTAYSQQEMWHYGSGGYVKKTIY